MRTCEVGGVFPGSARRLWRFPANSHDLLRIGSGFAHSGDRGWSHADTTPRPTMIEVRSLTKTYERRLAVDDLSFTAPPGEVTGFLGPNGAGKTTMFRCLLGLAAPRSGAALIDGRPYRELENPRRQVGAVLESTGFHPARNHMRVIARAVGIDPTRIDELLSRRAHECRRPSGRAAIRSACASGSGWPPRCSGTPPS